MHSKHEVDRQRRRRRVGNKGGMPGARRRELVVGQEACGGGGDDEEHEEEERPTSGAEERGHADEADAASCARADLAVSSELSSKFLRLLNVPMIRSGSVGISDPQWLFFSPLCAAAPWPPRPPRTRRTRLSTEICVRLHITATVPLHSHCGIMQGSFSSRSLWCTSHADHSPNGQVS